MPATAADLPQELFEDILWHAAHPLAQTRALSPPSSTNPAIRILGQFTLVSRYWASVCRPQVFESLVLKRYSAFQGLLAILDVGPGVRIPSVAAHIQYLDVEYREGDPPWIHLLVTRLLPRIQLSSSYVRLGLETTLLGVGQKAFPHHLPRSLPAFFFAAIRQLVLYNINAKDGRDLIRYLVGLTQVESLTLENVTWEIAPDLDAAHRLPKALTRVVCKCLAVSVSSCGPWFAVGMLSAGGKRKYGRGWEPSERSDVLDIFRVMLPDTSLFPDAPIELASGLLEEGTMIVLNTKVFDQDRGPLYTPTFRLECLGPVQPSILGPPSSSLHIRRITVYPIIDVRHKAKYTVRCLQEGAWTQLSERVLQLQHLQNVDFQFANSECLSDFLDLQFECLRGLHAAGKSTYSVSRGAPGGYVTVDPLKILQEREGQHAIAPEANRK